MHNSSNNYASNTPLNFIDRDGYLCVSHSPKPQDVQIFGPILFYVCWQGCFQTLTWTTADGTLQSVESLSLVDQFLVSPPIRPPLAFLSGSLLNWQCLPFLSTSFMILMIPESIQQHLPSVITHKAT